MAVTPLQVCTAVAAAVNGGYLVTPHVVTRYLRVCKRQRGGADRLQRPPPGHQRERQRHHPPDHEYEVGDGTNQTGGYRAYVAGYRIGGKSGTSELLNMDRRADGDYKKAAPL